VQTVKTSYKPCINISLLKSISWSRPIEKRINPSEIPILPRSSSGISDEVELPEHKKEYIQQFEREVMDLQVKNTLVMLV